TAMMPAVVMPLDDRGGGIDVLESFMIISLRSAGGGSGGAATVHQAENHGHEKQRGGRGERQSADDRAAQRGVLLAALADPERHRHHADNHRQRRHQHRAESRKARLQRGRGRIEAPFMRSRAKLTTRMLLAVATPMHMM